MTDPEGKQNAYVGGTPVRVVLRQAPFLLVVHLGIINGRVACVGLDVRAFEESADRDPSRSGPPTPLAGWQELNTARLREVRLGEAVEHAITAQRALLEEVVDLEGIRWAEGELERLTEQLSALASAEEGPKRVGRPAVFSRPEVVDVVIEAYNRHVRQEHGKKPVVAVRDALEKSGLIEGAGEAAGHVTMDQARAAVRRARAIAQSRGIPMGKEDLS